MQDGHSSAPLSCGTGGLELPRDVGYSGDVPQGVTTGQGRPGKHLSFLGEVVGGSPWVGALKGKGAQETWQVIQESCPSRRMILSSFQGSQKFSLAEEGAPARAPAQEDTHRRGKGWERWDAEGSQGAGEMLRKPKLTLN